MRFFLLYPEDGGNCFFRNAGTFLPLYDSRRRNTTLRTSNDTQACFISEQTNEMAEADGK
jgi:hypothetical protein